MRYPYILDAEELALPGDIAFLGVQELEFIGRVWHPVAEVGSHLRGLPGNFPCQPLKLDGDSRRQLVIPVCAPVPLPGVRPKLTMRGSASFQGFP